MRVDASCKNLVRAESNADGLSMKLSNLAFNPVKDSGTVRNSIKTSPKGSLEH